MALTYKGYDMDIQGMWHGHLRGVAWTLGCGITLGYALLLNDLFLFCFVYIGNKCFRLFLSFIIFADLSNKERRMFLEKSKNARKMMMRNSKSMYSFIHAYLSTCIDIM